LFLDTSYQARPTAGAPPKLATLGADPIKECPQVGKECLQVGPIFA
jgi:hypothetical protein